MLKFAYFISPHIGGTWTVYKSVRAALAHHGVDVRWLGVGPSAQAVLDDPLWAMERSAGAVAGGDAIDERTQAKALMGRLQAVGYDGLFVNAACNRVHSNIVRYLDPAIRRIMTVHNTTVATYAGARVLRDHVHAVVCVSPRIRDDLVARHGFPSEVTQVIPNALDLIPFSSQLRGTETIDCDPLRLLSLGRLIDTDKGVLWLPRILDHVADRRLNLTIAGDGPDRAELERRCAHLGARVRFLGSIPPDKVPEVLASHDVFLFPSRFEGLGLALVEAMASGCVPVASRIKGVTDFVVEDGVDGLLFGIGDTRGAARCVDMLARDRVRLRQLAAAARRNVADRFDLPSMGRGYAKVVRSVVDAPRQIASPLPLSDWSYPAGLRPGLRTYLPVEVKKLLRLWREQWA